MPRAKVASVRQVGRARRRHDSVAHRHEIHRRAGQARRIDDRPVDAPAPGAGQIRVDKVVEHLAIDKIINGLGSSVVAGSKVARLVQNGGIGYYVFIMIIGVVLLLALNVLK